MTPYQEKFLAHCQMMHALEPDYARKAARNFARIDPDRLADLPGWLEQWERGVQHEIFMQNRFSSLGDVG